MRQVYKRPLIWKASQRGPWNLYFQKGRGAKRLRGIINSLLHTFHSIESPVTLNCYGLQRKTKMFAALCKGLGPWCCRLASSHSNNCKELGSLEKKREEESERLASRPVRDVGRKENLGGIICPPSLQVEIGLVICTKSGGAPLGTHSSDRPALCAAAAHPNHCHHHCMPSHFLLQTLSTT